MGICELLQVQTLAISGIDTRIARAPDNEIFQVAVMCTRSTIDCETSVLSHSKDNGQLTTDTSIRGIETLGLVWGQVRRQRRL